MPPNGISNKSGPLPLTPEEVTPAWLSSVLGYEVASFETTSQKLDATTAKLCLKLHWTDEDAARSAGLPHHVCVKGGFVPAQMDAIPDGGMLKMYTTEAMWFREVAPLLRPPVEVPRCWWSGADAGNAIVIMDDLAAAGCTFGDGTKDYSVEWAREVLTQLAGLHAVTWGAKAGDHTWMDSNSYTNGMLGLMTMWDALILSPDRPQLPDRYKNREWVEAVLKRSWANVDPKTRVLMHGDPHAGNTYMLPTGEPRLLDLQCVAIGSALGDVAYCLGSALSISDRRAHELELLDHYLARLAEAGGPRLERDEVMTEFRRGYILGWGWLITPYGWHPEARVRSMASRYVAAMEDHGTMELAETMELYPTE